MKKFLKTALTGLFCLISLLNFTAPVFAAINVVKPNANFYVLDNAGVLSYKAEEHIVLNNDMLYDACGAQIVFVTLDTTGGTDINDYAYELFNTWGIGSAEKNNGILILMAIHDDDYAYQLGMGIESKLSVDKLSEMVYQCLEPDFAAKDYAAGALKLFNVLYNKVASIYGVTSRVRNVTNELKDGEEPIVSESEGLQYMIMNGVVYIYGYTGNDEQVIIPSELYGYSVKIIGDSAFYGCSSLIEVDLPKSVIYIGDDAFVGCNNLSAVVIPPTVKYISQSAFKDLESIELQIEKGSYAHQYALDNGIPYRLPLRLA